ncbi:protein TolR [Chitinibacteraceae bacterium HSL-7]
MSRRPRRGMSQINVVPYIDVMLVLLIIFMVTAPMLQPGTIQLPSVGATTDREVDAKPLRVEIAADGRLALVDEQDTQSAADVNALIVAVKAKLAEVPQRPVVVAGDKEVKYQEVIRVMDALKLAEVSRVGLWVEPQPKQ